MERPVRKPNRLREYDYSQPGCYFVTICTKERLPLLRRGAQCAPVIFDSQKKMNMIGHYHIFVHRYHLIMF